VAQVLAQLRERHVTVPVFNYAQSGSARNLSHVPGAWYVYDADPWAPGSGHALRRPHQDPNRKPAPQPGTPVPSPTS